MTVEPTKRLIISISPSRFLACSSLLTPNIRARLGAAIDRQIDARSHLHPRQHRPAKATQVDVYRALHLLWRELLPVLGYRLADGVFQRLLAGLTWREQGRLHLGQIGQRQVRFINLNFRQLSTKTRHSGRVFAGGDFCKGKKSLLPKQVGSKL